MRSGTVSDNYRWKREVERAVAMPLDAMAMPRLKRFQLKWSLLSTRYYRRLNSAKDKEQFIQYFETLVTRFEQRGVLSVETYESDGFLGFEFQPIRNVLAACKKS